MDDIVVDGTAPDVAADTLEPSAPDVEVDNLFEPITAQDEPKPEEPQPEDPEERVIFDTLKAKYEPDTPNFKSLKTALEEKNSKLESLKSFEPLAQIPGVAEGITKLTNGQVTDGNELLEALTSVVGTPAAVDNIRSALFWGYAENPEHADTIAKGLLGQHMSGALLQTIAKATDPNAGWISTEDLLEDLQDLKTGNVPDEKTLEERARLKQEQAEWEQVKATAKKEQDERAQSQRHQEYQQAQSEIFANINVPVDDVRNKFGFAPNPKDSPAIADIRKDASLMYSAVHNWLMQDNQDVHTSLVNLDRMIQENPSQKARAEALYMADIQVKTREVAVKAARMVNTMLKPRIMQLQADLSKGTTAPAEPGSIGATSGGGPGEELSRVERAMRAYKGALDGGSSR